MRQVYKIVHVDNDHEIFEKQVNKCLEEGWELWMGPRIVSYECDGMTYFIYTQAMVRYTDPEELKPMAMYRVIAEDDLSAEIGAVAKMIAPLVAGLVPVRLDPTHPVWMMMDILQDGKA